MFKKLFILVALFAVFNAQADLTSEQKALTLKSAEAFFAGLSEEDKLKAYQILALKYKMLEERIKALEEQVKELPASCSTQG